MAFASGTDTADAETAAETAEASSANALTNTETSATETPAIDDTDRVRVVALRSTARDINSAVVLRGRTAAKRQVEVRAETTARVISAPLRKGNHVSAGDTLCKLDPGTRPAELSEAKARLAEAKARHPEAEARLQEAHALLREAEINLTAAAKLSKEGYASETRLASAEAAERSALAAIASAESGLTATAAGIEAAAAGVSAAEKELEHVTILAPFDGLLESDSAELGSLLQPGSLCATVIQLDEIKLVGFVPEAEVDRVTTGAIARAKLASGAEVEGRVTFVSRSADAETRTFEVDITVANDDLSIRDGQTADISIAAPGTKAHLLPQSSLTLNNLGQLGVRLVGDDGRVDFMPVKLIGDTIEGVWLEGLPETLSVIIVGQEFVTKGVAVHATYKEAF